MSWTYRLLKRVNDHTSERGCVIWGGKDPEYQREGEWLE